MTFVPPGWSSGKSSRTCMHPSPKCPNGAEVILYEATSSSKRGQVLAEPRGGTAASSHPGQAGLPDGARPASPAPSSRMRQRLRLDERVLDDDGVVRDALRHQAPGPRAATSPSVVAGELDEQPGASARAAAGSRRARAGRAARRCSRESQALAGRRPVRHDGRGGLAGRDDVGEAEDDDDPDRGVDDQLDGRLGDDRQGALGADEGLGEVEPLGQQVVRRVARDLPAEPVELGARRREVPGHHRADPGEHVVGTAGIRHARLVVAGGQRLPGRGEQLEAGHVVGGAAVGQRPRAAGVVADHPADRAARVRRRVRARSACRVARRPSAARRARCRARPRRSGPPGRPPGPG